MARKRAAHPGFKKAQAQIAKRQGISKKRAGAILAGATRRASAAAKKRNPRLKRVKGAPKRRKPKRRTTRGRKR